MPDQNQVNLTVTTSCDASGGTINASAYDTSYNSEDYVVNISIYASDGGANYHAPQRNESTSITISGLTDDVYTVAATSTNQTTNVQEILVQCMPQSGIGITPILTLPGTITLDIASNLKIISDIYTGNSKPDQMTDWTRTATSDKTIHCVGIINQNLNFLTFGVTVTDEQNFTQHLDIYWHKAIYTKTCGANQSGSYTATKTAFSFISIDDARIKAAAAANQDADANLKCDTDIRFVEVQMIDKSFAVSYSLEAEVWACFHDYVPDAIFCTANKLMSFKNQRIYIHNQSRLKGWFYNRGYKSQIEFVVANLVSKAYHAINWKSQYKTDGVIDERKTFTAIMLYNHNQCSGEQPITLKKTTRNAEGVWRFNEFRDLIKNPQTIFLDEKGNVIPSNIMANKSFFKQSRFIGDYICVRMIFDNANLLSEIVLSDFSINDKVSYR